MVAPVMSSSWWMILLEYLTWYYYGSDMCHGRTSDEFILMNDIIRIFNMILLRVRYVSWSHRWWVHLMNGIISIFNMILLRVRYFAWSHWLWVHLRLSDIWNLFLNVVVWIRCVVASKDMVCWLLDVSWHWGVSQSGSLLTGCMYLLTYQHRFEYPMPLVPAPHPPPSFSAALLFLHRLGWHWIDGSFPVAWHAVGPSHSRQW